jgi:hypothetical protein
LVLEHNSEDALSDEPRDKQGEKEEKPFASAVVRHHGCAKLLPTRRWVLPFRRPPDAFMHAVLLLHSYGHSDTTASLYPQNIICQEPIASVSLTITLSTRSNSPRNCREVRHTTTARSCPDHLVHGDGTGGQADEKRFVRNWEELLVDETAPECARDER